MRNGRRRTTKALAMALVALASGVLVPSASGRAVDTAERDEIRLAVAYDATMRAATLAVEAAVADHGGQVVRVDEVLHFAVVTVPAARKAPVTRALAQVPAVTLVEEDVVVEATYSPNDQFWGGQWGPQAIGVGTAWETGTSSNGAACTASAPCLGSHGRVVAVIDTGIDFTHPDVAPNYCYDGPNFFSPLGRPWDDHGHGTAVAGAAAAKINNFYDVAGVSDSCLVAIKVLGADGRGNQTDLASAIRWAADNGVDVVNMSLGGGSGSPLVEMAIDYASSKGVLLVAAAGNDGCSSVDYPAAFPKVIAVGSLATSTLRSDFSDCGPEIDLAAPGEGIYTTGRWCCTIVANGTSIASPLVAGVAALIWDRRPTMTPGQVRCALADTADDLGPAGRDNEFGDGRVDADGAIAWMATRPILPSWPTCASVPPGPPRQEEATYTAGNDAVVECVFNTGGACFSVQPGDFTVDLSIDDVTSFSPLDDVPGTYRMLGSDGGVLATGSFCNAIADLAIANGANTLEVRAGGAVDATLQCGLPDALSFGFIEARFNGA